MDKKKRKQYHTLHSLSDRQKRRILDTEVSVMFQKVVTVDPLNVEFHIENQVMQNFASHSDTSTRAESDTNCEATDVECCSDTSTRSASSLESRISDSMAAPSTANDPDPNPVLVLLDTNKLKEGLLKYFLTSGNIGSSCNLLLNEMRSAGIPDLPERRKFLKLRRKLDLEYFSDGVFHYFGIQKMLHFLSEIHNLTNVAVLQLSFDVDGVPLFNSDRTEFWCILGKTQLSHVSVFPVAIWCGRGKPELEPFLSKFVDEVNYVLSNGVRLLLNTCSIVLGPIIADAPAKAYIKNTIQYSGYHGCDYCATHGERTTKVIFTERDAEIRTDESFRSMDDEDHHKGSTPLTRISQLDMIYSFPHDSLHHLNSGVMKTLMTMWFVQKKGKYKIKASRRQVASSRMYSKDNDLRSYRRYAPTEFNRPPRSLKYMSDFKASEFEHILLYYGISLLEGILCDKMYRHFLLLHSSIFVFSSDSLHHLQEKANQWLRRYVKTGLEIYGADYGFYNTHNLIHLYDDVKHWGKLQIFSSYPFESFLGVLKNMLNKPNYPLSQVVIYLYAYVSNKVPFVSRKQRAGIQLKKLKTGVEGVSRVCTYEQMETELFCLDISKTGNNVVLLKNGDVFLVRKIASENKLIRMYGNTYEEKDDAYDYPIKSSKLRIYRVTNLSHHKSEASLEDIACKYCVIPNADDAESFVVVPLAHTLQ